MRFWDDFVVNCLLFPRHLTATVASLRRSGVTWDLLHSWGWALGTGDVHNRWLVMNCDELCNEASLVVQWNKNVLYAYQSELGPRPSMPSYVDNRSFFATKSPPVHDDCSAYFARSFEIGLRGMKWTRLPYPPLNFHYRKGELMLTTEWDRTLNW